jgi:hypothetical protein
MAIKNLSEEQIKEMCKMYAEDKKSSTEIASVYNVNSETIRKWIKRSGVKMRTSGESMSAGLNHNFFEIIDNENKAYWLGFLLADGCIGLSCGTRRSIRMFLSNKDENSIYDFSKDIEYKGKLRFDKVKNQTGICFNSQKFADHLISKGYIDWKNGNPRILDHIPCNIFNHFVRGFFDGDGCITFRQRTDRPSKSYTITFAADHNHFDCLDKLESCISEYAGISKNGPKRRSTGTVIVWTGNRQVSCLGKWLYDNASIFMDRKKEKFDQLNGGCDFDFKDIQIVKINDDSYINFYNLYHYMGTGGRRGFTIGSYFNSKLIASCTFGSITRKEIAVRKGVRHDKMMELVRFCIHPNYHKKNFASWFMAKCIKIFKDQYRHIDMLVSFADTTEGHEGTIYKATNWEFDGKTGKSYHYEDKEGNKIHKKTIFDTAKKNGMKENQYYKDNNLIKVIHEPKNRFFFNLRSK